MVAEVHHNHVGNRPGRGGGVGVLGRTITGVSLGFGSGVTSRVGVGTGDRVGIGSGRYGIFGGYPRDSSANTAAALSNNRITTLSHIADLWVEYAFMGVLLSSLAAFSAEHPCLLEMCLQENSFRISVTSAPREIFFASAAYRVTTTHSLSLEDDDACVSESPDFQIRSVPKHSRH
jgi:hypothetical protein